MDLGNRPDGFDPRTFFVLMNTQKGKTRVVLDEIRACREHAAFRPVVFFVTSNDKTLAENGAQAIEAVLLDGVRVYRFSSAVQHDGAEFDRYVDRYEMGDAGFGATPVVVLLSNKKQWKKALGAMRKVHDKVAGGASPLRCCVIFDEADRTYPHLRSIAVDDGGTFVDLLESPALWKTGFVTATDGDLVENDEYPECANAKMLSVESDAFVDSNYRALHHPDSVLHPMAALPGEFNNGYALRLLTEHAAHFSAPVALPMAAAPYYRKVIVNTNNRVDDMAALATHLVHVFHFYAVVFNGENGLSVKVYRPGEAVETVELKRRRLNETLYVLYKTLGLHDRPLILLGKKKVDRGLSFHYAPREVGDFVIPAAREGDLLVRGGEGLIWTDIILGNIDARATAVQKAGRGAGIIAQCPQYPPGGVHYWAPAETLDLVRAHNAGVDSINLAAPGATSAARALQQHSRRAPVPEDPRGHPILVLQMPSHLPLNRGSALQFFYTNHRAFFQATLLRDEFVFQIRNVTEKDKAKLGYANLVKPGAKTSRSIFKQAEDARKIVRVYRFRGACPPNDELVVCPWSGDLGAVRLRKGI